MNDLLPQNVLYFRTSALIIQIKLELLSSSALFLTYRSTFKTTPPTGVPYDLTLSCFFELWGPFGLFLQISVSIQCQKPHTEQLATVFGKCVTKTCRLDSATLVPLLSATSGAKLSWLVYFGLTVFIKQASYQERPVFISTISWLRCLSNDNHNIRNVRIIIHVHFEPSSGSFLSSSLSSVSSSCSMLVSNPGKCSNRLFSRAWSRSVSWRKTHHRRKPMVKTLIGRTFHHGRWNLLPMERSTFHVRWLALLVENLMGWERFSSPSVEPGEWRGLP